MRPIHPIFAAVTLALLVGCAPGLDGLSEPGVVRFTQAAPDGADPGACWGKQVAPAVIETETEQVLVRPAQVDGNGALTSPAIYRTETRQKITREREETWFETPCEADLTVEFIETLQRALAVRGYYVWPVNGLMDAQTRAAIRRYQAPQGLDSGILSMRTAEQLGLVSVGRSGADISGTNSPDTNNKETPT